MHIHSVEPRPHALHIRWADSGQSEYPNIFLRDNCPSGFHPQTQERTFDLLSVPADIKISSATLHDGKLAISWGPPAAHESLFDTDWLYAHRPGRRADDLSDVASASWDASFLHSLPRHDAAALSRNHAAMREWLIETNLYGLSLVTRLADDEEAGVRFGEEIGFLRRTNFGETFRVETRPDPNNLAYTSHALALHTDLPNQELPPGFQFLHCVRNDAAGGGSTFADSFRIAEKSVMKTPKSSGFCPLCQSPIASTTRRSTSASTAR